LVWIPVRSSRTSCSRSSVTRRTPARRCCAAWCRPATSAASPARVSTSTKNYSCPVRGFSVPWMGQSKIPTFRRKHMSIGDIKGKAKEALGDATGDEFTKAEGKINQAKSDLQNKANDAKDKAAEAFNNATDK